MSSFKNAAKSHQKTHRERSQPAYRAHLGLLEKKKDYKLRAVEHQKKKAIIKGLKRKALDKNPDEFYHQMVNTRLKEGVHTKTENPEERTDAQIKLMHTQDASYVNYKRSTELKKIERLKSNLHMLDTADKPQNQHIVFVDSKKEAKKFDAAKYFDTHPALVGRTYNRLRKDDLKKAKFLGASDPDTIEELGMQRQKKYEELSKRLEREKQLTIIAQKLEMKKNLLDKKTKKKKVADETRDSAAIYKWVPQR